MVAEKTGSFEVIYTYPISEYAHNPWHELRRAIVKVPGGFWKACGSGGVTTGGFMPAVANHLGPSRPYGSTQLDA